MNYEDGIEKIISGLKQYDGFFSKDYFIDFEAKSQ